MDQTTGSLPDHSLLLPGKLDVDAYYRLAREEGFLDEARRVELIDGELVWMNAVNSPHAGVVNRLTRLLIRAAGDQATVSVQNPVRLDAWNEPEPDVALLLPRADDYGAGHPSAADALLLIEVSDTSLARDRGPKRALYARFGIREYWIVDIEGGRVEVCREPSAGTYASVETAGPDAVLTVAALPEVSLPVRDILG